MTLSMITDSDAASPDAASSAAVAGASLPTAPVATLPEYTTLNMSATDAETTTATTSKSTTSALGPVPRPRPRPFRNPLHRGIHTWHAALPSALSATLPPLPDLLASAPTRHTLYGTLLVLPADAFARSPWPAALAACPPDAHASLYAALASAAPGGGATHVVAQAPIPRLVGAGAAENTWRAPRRLRPLHGEFGPPPGTPPDAAACAAAYWATTWQHGVAQCWAPLHTMFARGNVGEKQRVLELARRERAMAETAAAAAAVDLYAGIGYFAFCYARAGYRPVLCWELNGWSIEGLRRGAAQNDWTVRVVTEDETLDAHEAEAYTLIVFHESNVRALARLEQLRSHLPPVRHVNCGYLPSSEAIWADAVRMLGRVDGGWVHAHENCAVAEVDAHATEAARRMGAVAETMGHRAYCEHVERVKSYAPGVVHCVFDVRIGPPAGVAA